MRQVREHRAEVSTAATKTSGKAEGAPSTLEDGLLVIMLFLCTGAGSRILTQSRTASTFEGGTGISLILAALATILGLVIARRLRVGGILTTRFAGDWLYLSITTLLLIGAAGALRMSASAVSVFEGVLRYASGIVCGFVAASFGLQRLCVATYRATFAITAVGLGLTQMAPGLAYTSPLGNVWAGIMQWNSSAALVAAILLATTLNPLLPPINRLIGAAFGLWALVLSQSRSVQLALLASASIVILLRTRSVQLRIGICALGLAGGCTIVSRQRNSLFLALGKDPTLSGRSTIWEVALQGVATRPVFGYGPGNYWKLPSVQGGFIERLATIDSAHSGYLDAMLAGGVFASLAIVLLLVRGVRRTAVSRRQSEAAEFATAVLVLVGVVNLSLSLLLRNGIAPTLFVALTAPVEVLRLSLQSGRSE
jgi:exopolysaccharide production protein ExoQ